MSARCGNVWDRFVDIVRLLGQHACVVTETNGFIERRASERGGGGRSVVGRGIGQGPYGLVTTLEDVRAGVVERLRARRSEIEGAIFAHVGDADRFGPAGGDDPEYVAGLHASVAAALEYILAGIEHGEEWPGPIPSVAVEQAQRAARHGVGLDTVLRRYVAGQRLMSEFIMAEADGLPMRELHRVLALQGMLVERLIAGVSSEYECEDRRVGASLEQRRSERVRRLLASEPVDMAELDYDFDAWHLGVIATGGRAQLAVRGLQTALRRQSLSVSHGRQTVWAWLGGKHRLEAAEIERVVTGKGLSGVSLTVGEPAEGMRGWRVTHRQAQEALLVALRRPQSVTRFADVALLVPWLEDPARARSMVEIYLSPLDSLGDDGHALRETLRAYFAAGHSIEATAAELVRDRGTVRRRLRRIEQVLGCPVDTRQAELVVAMRLEELDSSAGHPDSSDL
jgi:PucR-like helix-turn-helix protein/diguanylate cyclase with GGDEF domain